MPKKIIVVSSAPQIRYPDCYGIDMSKLGDFIAFRAAIELLKERNMEQVLKDAHDRIKEMQRNNSCIPRTWCARCTNHLQQKRSQPRSRNSLHHPV
jgi:glutamine phosphoribosylpyrophosphate amidotransferase